MRILRWFQWGLCAVLALSLLGGLARPLLAADDDDEDGGATLDAGGQWKLCEMAWNARRFDEAAAFMRQFAEANPDDNNALEAWWRTFEVYRGFRPNAERRKMAFEKAMTASDRWTQKYATSSKERAARGLRYQAFLLDREGNRPQAIVKFTDMIKRFPGTQWDGEGYWHLAEWLREAKRYQEAVPNYQGYRKVAGINEQSAMAAFREGYCHEASGNREGAIGCYMEVHNNGNYHRHWHQVWSGLIDAARRLRGMGEEELCRKVALSLLDKLPQDWYDQRRQIGELVNIKVVGPGKYIQIYPHLNESYTTERVNIDGTTSMKLTRDMPLKIQLERVSKEDAFKGAISITPKFKPSKEPFKATEEKGEEKVYSAEIVAPDEKGGVKGEWMYQFGQETDAKPPDNLVISRKWEKTGEGWGMCTIRIQSTAKWHIWIQLPNTKTNVNNLSQQPHEVQANGRTFKWHDWMDITQGWTVKFPVEVGGNVSEYYPHIRLERGIWGWGGAEKHSAGTDALIDPWPYRIKLTAEASFPYSVRWPGGRTVLLNEISK
jgi:tetratricopeptide (TPR) repeat protein